MPLCVYNGAFQVVLVVKNPPAIAGDLRDMNLIPGSGRSPAEGNGNPFHSIPVQSIPVFLPGKSHGQRSLAGYSPWGLKESDMAYRLSTHAKRPKEFKKRLEFSCWTYLQRDRELSLL